MSVGLLASPEMAEAYYFDSIFTYGELAGHENAWAMNDADSFLDDSEQIHLQAEEIAARLLSEKTKMLTGENEEWLQVEMPTDVLGNFRRLVALESGGASKEVIARAETEAYWDAYLGFGEKMQKLSSDLPEARWFDVKDDGSIMAGDVPHREMFEQAITPLATEVEIQRRTKELGNTLTFEALAHSELAETHNFMVLSLIPNDKATLKNAYVPDVKKMMINFVSFHDTPDGKKMKLQIGAIHGVEFDLGDAVGLLKSLGQVAPGAALDETDVLGMVTPLSKSEFSDVTDAIAMLDNFDEKDLYMGEVVSPGQSKNYMAEHQISRNRYKKFEEEVWNIFNYSKELARAGVRAEEAEGLVEACQKELAREICRINPEQAKITFSDVSAARFYELARLEAVNDVDGVRNLNKIIDDKLEAMLGCGGGSCDLYRETTVVEKAEAARLGMNGDKLNGYAKCKCGNVGLLQDGIGSSAVYGCSSCGTRSDSKNSKEETNKPTLIQRLKGESGDEESLEDGLVVQKTTLELRSEHEQEMQERFGPSKELANAGVPDET